MDKDTNDPIFLTEGVEKSCNEPIYIIFQTLLLKKSVRQQTLADYLGVDKAYISRIVHGIETPPLLIKMKIAKFFDTDTALIWRKE